MAWSPDLPEPARPNHAPKCPIDRSREEWRPIQPAPDRPLRRAMYGLRDDIRRLQQPRVQACGRAVVGEAGAVSVVVDRDGRARLSGLAHCGSVWECPTCQMGILQGRARQLTAAISSWGPARVGMVTMTIRHGAGENLGRLRRLLSKALGMFTRQRAYREWCARVGLVGRVRALEVTHGENGWHPHLHLLMVFDQPLKLSWTAGEGGALVSSWDCPELAELRALWRRCVVAVFGQAHEPDDDHGLVATKIADVEYLAKMGLELADPGVKEGRKANQRTPFQIAADYARRKHATQRESDGALWRAYCEGMRGAHRLVWSTGLKKRLGVLDVSDAEILAADDCPEDTDVIIATIPRDVWRVVRDMRVRGEAMAHALMVAAERGGGGAVRLTLLQALGS